MRLNRCCCGRGQSEQKTLILETGDAQIRQLHIVLEEGARMDMACLAAAPGYGRIEIDIDVASGAHFEMGGAIWVLVRSDAGNCHPRQSPLPPMPPPTRWCAACWRAKRPAVFWARLILRAMRSGSTPNNRSSRCCSIAVQRPMPSPNWKSMPMT